MAATSNSPGLSANGLPRDADILSGLVAPILDPLDRLGWQELAQRGGGVGGTGSGGRGGANWQQWRGTVWSADGRLQQLNLVNKTLNGRLPIQMAMLNALESIMITGCGITGGLPDSWISLSSLRALDLSLNRLQGGIPPGFFSMHLQSLSLGYNQFTGPVPDLSASPIGFISLRNNNLTFQPSLIPVAADTTAESVDLYNNPLCAAALSTPPTPPSASGAPNGNDSSISFRSPSDLAGSCFWRARPFCSNLNCEASSGGSSSTSNGNGPLEVANSAAYLLNDTCLCSSPITLALNFTAPPFSSFNDIRGADLAARLAFYFQKKEKALQPEQVWTSSAAGNSAGGFLVIIFISPLMGMLWPPYSDASYVYIIKRNRNLLEDNYGPMVLAAPGSMQPPPERRPSAPQPLLSPSPSPVVDEPPPPAPSPPPPASSESSVPYSTWAVFAAAASAVFAGIIVGLCCLCSPVVSRSSSKVLAACTGGSGPFFRLTRSSSLGQRVQDRFVRAYSLKEVRKATGNWDEANLVGAGGYGRVFFAMGPNKQQWAVKRVEGRVSAQALRDFHNEIEIISQTNHRNLVKLLGFCDEHNEQILIYEFVANGCLRQHIRPSKNSKAMCIRLNFEQRVDIAVGAAEGLRYLHNFTTPSVIHRDVKSDNILLDEFMQAKVADFGFFKNMYGDDTPSGAVSTRVLGTPGYVDPEYYYTCKATTKCDVYSFGIVLWELITGKGPILELKDVEEDDQTFLGLAKWASAMLAEGRIESIVEPTLEGNYPPKALVDFATIAAMCTKEKSKERPEMTEVLTRLVELQRYIRDLKKIETEIRLQSPMQGSGRRNGDLALDMIALSGSNSEVIHSTTRKPPLSSNMGGR